MRKVKQAIPSSFRHRKNYISFYEVGGAYKKLEKRREKCSNLHSRFFTNFVIGFIIGFNTTYGGVTVENPVIEDHPKEIVASQPYISDEYKAELAYNSQKNEF